MEKMRKDEALRRLFWKEQMDAAYAFMEKIKEYPVTECGEPLISLKTVVEEVDVEVDFANTKAVKNYNRLFYLRKGLVDNFINLSREMNDRGWVMKVEDAYRTKEIQKYLALKENIFDVVLRRAIWECQGDIPSSNLIFRRLSALLATTLKTATHTSGSALDISVLNRDSRKEVERGGPYLELSELTPMDSPFVSAEGKNNRREITKLMKSHGFVAYPYEFWHYSSGDAFAEFLTGSGKKAKYGPINLIKKTGKIISLEKTLEPLHKSAEIMKRIRNALKKYKQ